MWYANGLDKKWRGYNRGFTNFLYLENGGWSLSRNAGWYTILSYKSGYYYAYQNVFACGNQPDQNNSMSEILNPGEMRIILKWPKTNPVTAIDLDSHLYIPIIDIDSSRGGDCDGDANKDDKCHLYYNTNQNAPPASYNGVTTYDYHIYGTGDNVTLDKDATSSPGDETITISKVRSGTYSFSIHNLTDYDNRSITNLRQSGAKVKVIYCPVGADCSKEESVVRKKFHAPNKNGTLWRVFTFNSSDSGGSGFTRVRTMTYQNTPANVY